MKTLNSNFIIATVKEMNDAYGFKATDTEDIVLWSNIITTSKKKNDWAPFTELTEVRREDSTHMIEGYYFHITPMEIREGETLGNDFISNITPDGKHYFPFIGFMKKHGLNVITL